MLVLSMTMTAIYTDKIQHPNAMIDTGPNKSMLEKIKDAVKPSKSSSSSGVTPLQQSIGKEEAKRSSEQRRDSQ
jgi:hypothetical protein